MKKYIKIIFPILFLILGCDNNQKKQVIKQNNSIENKRDSALRDFEYDSTQACYGKIQYYREHFNEWRKERLSPWVFRGYRYEPFYLYKSIIYPEMSLSFYFYNFNGNHDYIDFIVCCNDEDCKVLPFYSACFLDSSLVDVRTMHYKKQAFQSFYRNVNNMIRFLWNEKVDSLTSKQEYYKILFTNTIFNNLRYYGDVICYSNINENDINYIYNNTLEYNFFLARQGKETDMDALNDVVEELTTYKDEKSIYNAYYYYFVDRNVLFYVEQKEDSLYMRVLNDENFEPLCIF